MTTKPKKPRAKALTSSERVRLYRAKKKKAGMRLLQIWVPDTRSPKVKAELRRQARLLAKSPDSEEALRFIESHSADWDE
jgi:hypothetical protein